jgi:hypothetical protein
MMHQYNRTFQKKKQENPAYHQGRKSSGVFNELQSRSISVAGDKKITNTIALQESMIMSIDSTFRNGMYATYQTRAQHQGVRV